MKKRIKNNNILIVCICDSVGGTDVGRQSVGHSGSVCANVVLSGPF